MAHPPRFERGTSTFGGWRSIQLSYGCILLTQCLRELLATLKGWIPFTQAFVFQASFSLLFGINGLDTCLRRAVDLCFLRLTQLGYLLLIRWQTGVFWIQLGNGHDR